MIHPTALIDPSARLHEGVSVGAYTVIGKGVEIGPDTEIGHHVIIEGPTGLGAKNRIFPFASIGLEPQDKKFHGEDSKLQIGEGNTIREYVTINRGSEAGGWLTQVGNHNWIMAYCHIAHDCRIGNQVVMANGTTLGGHVLIEDYVVLGGLTAVHQFCRIGAYALTGGQSMIAQDIVPYIIAAGNRAKVAGLNYVGLERNGFSAQDIDEINKLYRIFFLSGLSKDNAVVKMRAELPPTNHLNRFIDFVESSQRGVCR